MQTLVKGLKTAALLGTCLLMDAALAGPVVLTKVDDKQVLDSSTKLVWASDWNLARTSTYDEDGLMSWNEAVAWISSLNAGNYAGHNNWRLPTSNASASSNCSNFFVPDVGVPPQYFGYGCTGSEMAYLFYAALGGKAGESIWAQAGDSVLEQANLALFTNVQSDYWSGTDYAPYPMLELAWNFRTSDGAQDLIHQEMGFHALAVRTDDPATAVPEPQTLALTCIALAGLAGTQRRRHPRRCGTSQRLAESAQWS